MPHGKALVRLAEATLREEEGSRTSARERVREAVGAEGLVDACAVIATFQQMDRIADSTGIPLDDMLEVATQSLRAEIGVERFTSAANTPRSPLRTFLGKLLAPLSPYIFRMVQAGARRANRTASAS